MYLFLDPRSQTEITVGLWRGKGKPRFLEYDREKEISLLGFITKRFHVSRFMLHGMVVIPGPGGFSTVRTAALFGNTMHFASDIPILVVKPKAGESLTDIFRRGVKLLQREKQSSVIRPIYSAAPNITLSKRDREIKR